MAQLPGVLEQPRKYVRRGFIPFPAPLVSSDGAACACAAGPSLASPLALSPTAPRTPLLRAAELGLGARPFPQADTESEAFSGPVSPAVGEAEELAMWTYVLP